MSAHTNGYRSPVSRKARDQDDASSVVGSEISGSNEHPHVDASDSPAQSSASQEENGATSEEESNSEEGADKTPSASADSSVESSESSHCSNGRNGRSLSYDSRRALKRKANIDDDEHIANNPELYGLRRSARARPTRRFVESSTEDEEDDDDDVKDEVDSDASELVGAKSRKRRKANPPRKGPKRASPPSESDDDSPSDSDSYRGRRKRNSNKKKSFTKITNAAAYAIRRAEARTSTRRATKVTSYNEDDDEDGFSEGSEVLTPNYGADAVQDDRPAIDAVLNHKLLEDRSKEDENISRDDFEYLIKWQGQAHYHATWEPTSTLANCRGYRRLENYFRKIVLEDIRMSTDPDVPPEEKEKWNLDRERDADALSDQMKVERVIGCRETDDGTEYYVKWKGLFYDSCTWESASLLSNVAQSEVDRFLDRTSRTLTSNKTESHLATRSPHRPIREQPSYIKGGELRDFQITGLNFLAYNWCKGNNVILADEMGLGKTVQTVSFLNWLRHDRQQEGPFLVVVPLSTLPAWTDTFMTWTPDINFVVYTGNESARKIIREYELCEDGNWKQTKFTVLLTTYEYILQDARELSQIKWQFMAVDEAHRLKNRESQLYAKLRDMKAPSRLLITGTPMQNTLGELAALMDFLMPGTVKIDEEINLQSQEAGKVIAELTNAIKPYILRRTKLKVENDLPPKCEKIIRVELADVQRTHYKNIITRNYAALNQGTKGHKQSLLNIVMELRKASNHPFMFENVKERILGGTDRRDEILKGIITSSGKMMLLDRLLTKLKKDNHRVLIFSQMVKMLDILSEYLQLRGYQFQRLDGTIPAGPRRMAIDHFNAPESNDFCFLLSTRAGGLGINLMTADTVILFDADWNPHADLQAMARAHRIGQKKAVSVYRFVAKDSIEEDVLLRARNKLLLEFITIQRGVTDESSKQYSDLLAKAGTHVNEPTSPDDISRLLRHRSQKMFEESSTQKKLEDLDIDAVLEDAEEHKVEGPAGLEADGGEEFLRSFNYLDVKLDPEWDDIIPQEQLVELKAEAKKQADAVYLDEVIQENAPRKRKAAGGGPERQERAVKRAREMAVSEEAANASEDDPSRPLGEKELRNLFRAFLRYGSLEDRTDEVLRDAHLVGRDLDLLRAAIAEITAKSKDLLEEDRLRVQELERASQKALTKKDRRAVLFDYKGVKRLNAETIVSRPGEMRLLKRVIESVPDPLNFRVPEASKAAHYSCAWGAREDSMLLVGILRHGYGAWTTIRDDPSLGMADKLFLEEQRVDKKEERTKGADKAAKSPGAVHLVRRADYLLSLLQEREARAKAAPRPPLTPEQTGGASGGSKRKSGADSDLSRAKRPRLPAADAGRALGDALSDPQDAILQKLFRPVRQSLKSVKAATKDGVPCKSERAKLLRRELLSIGAHIASLLAGCGQVDTLENSLWDFASKFWPNPGTPGSNLKSMHERLVAAEAAANATVS